MRLRQIALVAKELAPVQALFKRVFDLNIGFRDPGVGVFGLVNVVMPVGGEFLEIVEPVRADASAARYLTRRGGDAGYMVIIQDADALAHRARLAKQGVRMIAEMEDGDYVFTHFHPGDFMGVLASIDQVKGDADWQSNMSKWPPAGKDWKNSLSTRATGLTGVAIQAKDPDACAALWAQRLDKPAKDRRIDLGQGEIRFVPPVDADGSGVVELDIAVKDVAAVKASAKEAGVHGDDGRVRIGGVAVNVLQG
jgi:hypothetical protein